MKTFQHWQDIFQVLVDEIDVVLEVLDSRNPEGTHNHAIEKFIEKNKPQIKTLLLLNKADMIPKPVLARWHDIFLKKGFKVYAVSARYSRGVPYFLKKLREMAINGELKVLIVGYPNTGKSSLIEALTRGKKKLGVSPNAGYTRAIKKIKLTGQIYLYDTPGVIPIEETDQTEIAIKACMTVDKLEDPLAVVEAIFKLLPKAQINSLYGVHLTESDGVDEMIEKIGRKIGRIQRGGNINEEEVQKHIIRDWQSNKLHYFVPPPPPAEGESLATDISDLDNALNDNIEAADEESDKEIEEKEVAVVNIQPEEDAIQKSDFNTIPRSIRKKKQ